MAQYFNLVILESELPSQDILQDYGSYGDIVLHALRYTANPPIVHTSTLVVTKRSVLEQDPLPDVDETDGVLILGSKHSASDNDPWVPSLIRFIQQAYLMGKPLVGICYGHQMIARALGGKIARSPGGWELGVTDMDVNSTGRRVFGADKLHIHQMHRDAVVQLPRNVECIASSLSCKVQMMFEPGKVLTFQGHPEFNPRVSNSWLDQRYDEGEFNWDTYDAALATLNDKHDGASILGVVCQFLLEPQSPIWC